ncbi:MAG: hypothetical protein Q7S11_02715 [bacterium]|nr:hypothetical protein [bacterium]
MSTPETDAKNFAVRIIKLRIHYPSTYTSDNKAFDAVRREFRHIPLSDLKMNVGKQLAKLHKELYIVAREAMSIKDEGVPEQTAIMTTLGKHSHIPYSEDMVTYISKIMNNLEKKNPPKLKQTVISHAEKTSCD